ncbi:dienelactone hydrolase family protein [Marispirochaeta sp.]|uniref:dienelactone hydrolase family protein n=1 Tax=Marispirochaeta sp. TaxID=2038653 RepID=UPI0029C8B105|nr:dienelactone hydrolase family protein [Marispirochaeta sp.]
MRGIRIMLVSLLIAAFAAALFAQDMKDPGRRNVEFNASDGTTLSGYLALPSGSGRKPAVLMIHEWWGLNHDTVLLADALAEKGFVVLAADAFRGSVAREAVDARAQIGSTPREQIAGDLDAALDYLKRHPRADSSRIASLGFCFGGTHSMLMGTRRSDLAAVVIFYGGGPITEAGQLGVLGSGGPVLGIYGEEDGGIPVDQVRAFEAAMNSRGIENTVNVYPGVGHAFVKSDSYNKGGAPERAWKQMVDFLKTEL